ncbi:DUF3787 domain-containing protein [Christensenellaceae bacterium OttesenSCG-928-M15]|nr:DUF3787 domain-containing protein [Christensenellaceae bacterium OttesenSCG-928-M15]
MHCSCCNHSQRSYSRKRCHRNLKHSPSSRNCLSNRNCLSSHWSSRSGIRRSKSYNNTFYAWPPFYVLTNSHRYITYICRHSFFAHVFYVYFSFPLLEHVNLDPVTNVVNPSQEAVEQAKKCVDENEK